MLTQIMYVYACVRACCCVLFVKVLCATIKSSTILRFQWICVHFHFHFCKSSCLPTYVQCGFHFFFSFVRVFWRKINRTEMSKWKKKRNNTQTNQALPCKYVCRFSLLSICVSVFIILFSFFEVSLSLVFFSCVFLHITLVCHRENCCLLFLFVYGHTFRLLCAFSLPYVQKNHTKHYIHYMIRVYTYLFIHTYIHSNVTSMPTNQWIA